MAINNITAGFFFIFYLRSFFVFCFEHIDLLTPKVEGFYETVTNKNVSFTLPSSIHH